MKEIKYIDLFSGIGGMHLGLKRAARISKKKVNCLFYSEIDKYCVQTYEKNFPGSINLGDITSINEQQTKKFKNKVDIITAGFPCQPFSFAGNKKAFKMDFKAKYPLPYMLWLIFSDKLLLCE